ncbi:hypothetical protein JaAD80_08250 [Janthinobacterium sp. AD80]|nr:hypothetical protein JaAD80_08250 [Janthinobacterium sp. AD80]
MKKISARRRQWLIRECCRTMHARSRPPMKKRARVTTLRSCRVLAPQKFYFLGVADQKPLFDFLSLVKSKLDANFRVKINFDNTEEVHPCGTLIFLSHLDLWVDRYPGRVSCNYPRDPVVEELLQHVSALSKLGLTSRKSIAHERVKHWHYHYGKDLNSATYSDLTRATREGIVHPAKETFADCLNEAVANTVGHAYEHPFKGMPPEDQRKWWMLSLLKDDELFVAIYDQGIGIPGSLKRKPKFFEYFKRRTYNDGILIQAAIDSKLTRTRLPHRGKGLPEMLEFSEQLKDGGLSIWSQHGGMTYNAQRRVERCHKMKSRLPGTLVLWSIPFRKEQENARYDDINS